MSATRDPYAILLAARAACGANAISALDADSLFFPGAVWHNVDEGDGLVEALYLHQASASGGYEFDVTHVKSSDDSPGMTHFIVQCDRRDDGCDWHVEAQSDEPYVPPSSHGSSAADNMPLLLIVDSNLDHTHHTEAQLENGKPLSPYRLRKKADKIRIFELKERAARRAACKKAYRNHLMSLYKYYELNFPHDAPPPVRANAQDRVLDEFEAVWGPVCRRNMVRDLDKGEDGGHGHLFGGVHVKAGGSAVW